MAFSALRNEFHFGWLSLFSFFSVHDADRPNFSFSWNYTTGDKSSIIAITVIVIVADIQSLQFLQFLQTYAKISTVFSLLSHFLVYFATDQKGNQKMEGKMGGERELVADGFIGGGGFMAHENKTTCVHLSTWRGAS
ncbi:hypothetical protein GGS26DRAFT_23675 [Hypomontagnella submonticulosa]|nr:hypothetical protein GGS26DRAFT_23675 [Hypomontagnella submonticulosa]